MKLRNLFLIVMVALLPLQAIADTKAEARKAIGKGLEFLKSVQEEDGSWGKYPATTALAVSAFLRNGRTELKEPAVAKAVKYLLRSAKPNGAIYDDSDPALAMPNYNTALCLMALALTKNPAYMPTIKNAQQYIEASQFDDGEGIVPSDPMYGGIGYGSKKDRPDLSNLQLALEAMKDSGAPSSSKMWTRAITFLQRVQNRKESNDQAWAKSASGDGGFIYDSKGRSFSTEPDVSGSNGRPASYGSMTYAGLKSYIYAGVDKKDPRAQAAWDWIRAHYSVTEHPGMGSQSLYYYYHTMAKTFHVYGEKIVKDSKGTAHDWAQELAAEIVKQQRPEGAWVNANGRFWEDRPALVTSYTLIALSYCVK